MHTSTVDTSYDAQNCVSSSVHSTHGLPLQSTSYSIKPINFSQAHNHPEDSSLYFLVLPSFLAITWADLVASPLADQVLRLLEVCDPPTALNTTVPQVRSSGPSWVTLQLYLQLYVKARVLTGHGP